MSYIKSAGTAAKGNDRLLKSYGGSSGASPMARQKYASGGAVKGGNPSLSEGLSAADGAPAKPSLSRPGRKAPGKGKDAGKKGTTVNIVIAGKPDAGGPPKPAMDAGPPMPPPGPPGGPPMPPMRKHGGAVGRFAKGGRVKKADGGWTGEGDSGKPMKEKAAELREKAEANEKGAKSNAFTGAMATGVGATGPKFSEIGKLGKSLKGGALVSGIANLGVAGAQKLSAMGRRRDADAADKAGDEAEGRKTGGRIGNLGKFAWGGKVKRTTKGDEASKIAKDEESYATGGKVGGGDFHGLRNEDGGAMSGKGRLAKIKMYK